MSRIQDILVRVRDTVGDSVGTRWSDELLLRRLNEGQYDIAKKAEIFKKQVSIQIVRGKHLYVMPDDFIVLKGALFSQKALDIYPAQQMDRLYGKNWRMHTTTSRPYAVVTDRQDVKTIRLYPRPFIDNLYDLYTFTPDVYGIADTLTEYIFDSNVGVIGSIFDINLLDFDIDLFGIISDALEGDFVSIEYVRRPIYVTFVLEDPEILDVFDTALVRYVTGTALRDDIDTQNRSMGNEELILYQNELNDIEGISKHSNTSSVHNNTSEYRGMG